MVGWNHGGVHGVEGGRGVVRWGVEQSQEQGTARHERSTHYLPCFRSINCEQCLHGKEPSYGWSVKLPVANSFFRRHDASSPDRVDMTRHLPIGFGGTLDQETFGATHPRLTPKPSSQHPWMSSEAQAGPNMALPYPMPWTACSRLRLDRPRPGQLLPLVAHHLRVSSSRRLPPSIFSPRGRPALLGRDPPPCRVSPLLPLFTVPWFDSHKRAH
jgi:hypothetical protein